MVINGMGGYSVISMGMNEMVNECCQWLLSVINGYQVLSMVIEC